MHSSGMQTHLNGVCVWGGQQRICQKRNTLFKIPNISHAHPQQTSDTNLSLCSSVHCSRKRRLWTRLVCGTELWRHWAESLPAMTVCTLLLYADLLWYMSNLSTFLPIYFYLRLNFVHKLHHIIREVFSVRNREAADVLWGWFAGVTPAPRNWPRSRSINRRRPARHLGENNCGY